MRSGSEVRRKLAASATAYLFLLPALVGLLGFTVGPILYSLVLSLNQWDILTPAKFVGLQNFAKIILRDEILHISFTNTLYYAVLTIPPGVAVSLGLALMLNAKMRGVAVFRTLYFLPVVTSMVAVAVVWRWLYSTESGLFNAALALIGLRPIGWLSDPRLAMPSVALVSVWKNMGFNMVIFLAGLQAIPPHLYEAARIDGANRWQMLHRITLPLLTPTMFFVMVLAVIGSFQVFGLVYVMTEGGPGTSTYVYNYLLYRNAFHYLKMGYAAAMAWVLFAVILVITLVQVRFFGRNVQYELN